MPEEEIWSRRGQPEAAHTSVSGKADDLSSLKLKHQSVKLDLPFLYSTPMGCPTRHREAGRRGDCVVDSIVKVKWGVGKGQPPSGSYHRTLQRHRHAPC